MPIEIMDDYDKMDAFRERQKERPAAVPKDIERQNARSVQRSEKAAASDEPAGQSDVPDSVRKVISSAGQPLESSVQNRVEERMGDHLGDVRIHTGSQAAKACEDISARAFTVGNHVAFNRGEYEPESPEGQYILAHELAHVRQQTDTVVSMLPAEDVGLEIDPDPSLEREAEETAQRVTDGSTLGVEKLSGTDVHVQSLAADTVSGVYRVSQKSIRPEATDDHVQSQQGKAASGQKRNAIVQRHPKDGFSKDDGLETTRIIRTSLAEVKNDRGAKRSGNVAFAEININEDAYALVAVSGQKSPGYTTQSPTDDERTFETIPSGAMPRKNDTEVKILERLSKEYGKEDEGTVHLFTELSPCRSCSRVIDQFEQMFPNIEVKVSHGE